MKEYELEKTNNFVVEDLVDNDLNEDRKDINNMIYGIGMQLPIYLYLVKKNNLFPNSIIVGFYLQKIINKDMKDTTNKSAIELKEEALKIAGLKRYLLEKSCYKCENCGCDFVNPYSKKTILEICAEIITEK